MGEELLDFVRITNLFDTQRSGALYLTASDSDAPYMDVIDSLGSDFSLLYPTMGGGDQYAADRSRYAMQGESYLTETYTQSEGNVSRIYRLTRTSYEGTGKYGLKMVPEETVKAPERILVSFRIRASETLENIPVTFGYTDGSQSDYSDTLDADTQWEYRLAVFTVDYSKAVSAGIRNRSYGSTRSGVVAGDSRTQRRTSFGSRRLRSGRQGAYRQYQGHRRFRFRYAGRLRGLFQESLCFGERPHRRYADGCRRAGASEVPLRVVSIGTAFPEQLCIRLSIPSTKPSPTVRPQASGVIVISLRGHRFWKYWTKCGPATIKGRGTASPSGHGQVLLIP